MAKKSAELNKIYKKLYGHFGPQHWWPAETPFEVMVGAILTQNTNWQNVEKAICNLKKGRVLTPSRLHSIAPKKLAKFIKPSGYYNVKTRRLKEFLKFIFLVYRGSLKKMAAGQKSELRRQLLSVKGIGQETADSILLYALSKPVFVVDAYTKRILSRHKLCKPDAGYEDTQNLFMQNLKNEVKLFNEYHALLVRLGKEFCLKRNPRCRDCPIK
jgi:endonuclease III related protein